MNNKTPFNPLYMSSNTNNSRMPALRFPGFVGEWEEKTIGDIADVLQGFGFPDKYQGQTTGELPFCKVGDISAAVDKGERIISHAANYVDYSLLPTLHARPIPEGATIFAKIGEAIRSNKRIMTGCPCLIDNNAAAVKAKDGESDEFLFYLMSNVNLADYSGGIVPSVNKSTIEAISVFIPPTLTEQKIIAECLSGIDNLIAAQSQIVDAMKAKKKGLMQQLFPQNGETTPRLRFPGLEGEWIEKKLGDILIERKEISVITDELPQLSFTIAEGVIKPEDRKTNQRDFLMKDKDSKRFAVTRLNDIIYNPANVVFGAIHKNNLCDGVVSPIYKIFWTKENADFISYLLRRPGFISLLASRAEGTVTKLKTLKAEAFLDITVLFPTKSSEQRLIASCLSALDDTIQAETDKLETLNYHKKGLLQQLFPHPTK